MSDRIAIASRKGLFFFTRRGGGWSIGGDAFLGSPVTFVLRDDRDDALYAALNLGHFGPKLHRSEDDGKNWTETAMPAFARAEGEADAPSVVQVWAMTPAGPDRPGGLWAGTIPGGLFYSADRGQSWTLNSALWDRPEREQWMGGGYDQPGIHSICVDPGDSDRIAVAVSTGGVWESTDGGRSWDLRTSGLRAEYLPPELEYGGIMQDVHMMVQCRDRREAFWVQHHNGIFRSTDGLRSWREIKPDSCPAFGFAVAVHPHDPETAWFVPAVKDEFRYPKDAGLVVSRTRDGGRSFDLLTNGLPREPSYDLIYRHGMAIDGSGTRLVIGSTTGGAWVSENGGESWAMLPARLPPVYGVAFV